MLNIVSRLTQLSQHAFAKLKLGSALDPCLWLSGIVTPTGLIATYLTTGWIQVFCLVLVFIPVVIFAMGFNYFVRNDPDKLRSEQYEIKKHAFELIQEKGSQISVPASTVEAIANYDYERNLKQLGENNK